jgi:hypothetical protein
MEIELAKGPTGASGASPIAALADRLGFADPLDLDMPAAALGVAPLRTTLGSGSSGSLVRGFRPAPPGYLRMVETSLRACR